MGVEAESEGKSWIESCVGPWVNRIFVRRGSVIAHHVPRRGSPKPVEVGVLGLDERRSLMNARPCC